MANFLHVGTIESDDDDYYHEEIDDDEDEEQNNKKKQKKGKKKKDVVGDFEADFDFAVEGLLENQSWKIDSFIKERAKGVISSEVMENKIKQKRLQKKLKSQKMKESDIKEKEDDEIGDVITVGNHRKINKIVNDGQDNHLEDNETGDSEVDSEADDQSDQEEFFAQPPAQVKYKSFGQMNISRPLLKALNQLNFVHPTKVQAATIPVALLGKDVCACATTGSGKTAAFMLPILERLIFKPKQAVVTRVLILVPTRELAIQVHSVSQTLARFTDIQICLAAGGLDSKIQEAILRKSPDIIIATPGRLIDHLHNTPSFDLQTLEILVLDEADRMLEEHFKDQMEELIRLCPRGRQTMLFSATMTDQVQQLASLSLNHPVKLFVDQNTDVASNLQQEFVRIRAVREGDRLAVVAALCCRNFNEHCLIFLQTKRLAHKLRVMLGLLGLNVAELHGDLTQLQRLEALEKFKNNEVDVLVATDLAARGLDISGVKTVISYNMPSTIKSYIHRVGRTARAGKAGRSITLVGEKERKMLKEVVKNANVPVKNRIISTEVIARFKKKLEEIEKDVKDLLKQEEEEKQLRIAEMHANKAQNLILHHNEIMSRPARTFIKPAKKKVNSSSKKKVSNLSEEEKKIVHEQEFQIRSMKRGRKLKRVRACDEKESDLRPFKGRKKPKLVPSNSTFDLDLTDTTRKKVKELRSFGKKEMKKKNSGFKSKSKYRRKR